MSWPTISMAEHMLNDSGCQNQQHLCLLECPKNITCLKDPAQIRWFLFHHHYIIHIFREPIERWPWHEHNVSHTHIHTFWLVHQDTWKLQPMGIPRRVACLTHSDSDAHLVPICTCFSSWSGTGSHTSTSHHMQSKQKREIWEHLFQSHEVQSSSILLVAYLT